MALNIVLVSTVPARKPTEFKVCQGPLSTGKAHRPIHCTTATLSSTSLLLPLPPTWSLPCHQLLQMAGP